MTVVPFIDSVFPETVICVPYGTLVMLVGDTEPPVPALIVTVYVLAVKLAVMVLLLVIVPDAFVHELKEYPVSGVAVTTVLFIVTVFELTEIEEP